ncbi:MAG: hypothetical protein ACTSWY_13655 [Promethearchaeota archaeon]
MPKTLTFIFIAGIFPHCLTNSLVRGRILGSYVYSWEQCFLFRITLNRNHRSCELSDPPGCWDCGNITEKFRNFS